jgi:hypothetical protein
MKQFEETRVTLIRTALVAALLGAAATPALANQADETFGAFRKVCGDTRADYTAAVAAAGQSGWKNTDVTGSTMPGVTVLEKASRTKSAGDAALILSVTHGTASNGAVNVYTCTLQTDRGGFPDLESRTQAWLGFAPHDTSDSKVTFRFTDDHGALKAVADGDIEAAAAGSGVQILTVKRDGNNATLDYVKIKK